MEDSFLTDTFFPIIRAGLGLLSGELLREDLDYQRIIEIGKRQQILPIIWNGLNALGLLEEGTKAVESMCLNDIYLFVHRDQALDSIKSCFENNQIDYVLLKGAVLRDLYPEQYMRTSCDIDVLVREEDLEDAVRVLQKETGFKYAQRLYHDVSLTIPNVHLELHFSIKEDMENIDKLLSKAWVFAIKQKNTCQYYFSPEYQIFHIVSHMSYHFVHGGLGVRPYIDLWLLRHKTEYDENTVKKMCEQCNILQFYEECNYLAEVWLEGKEHSKTSKALENFSIEGGVFGSKKNLMLSNKRDHRGLDFYFSRLFVSNSVLMEMYPKAKKYQILLPYYQLRRWLRALFSKRKEVIQEIKSVRNTSDNEIESFDQLMKSVGM